MLEYLKHHADYLALHTDAGNRENNYLEFMASSLDLEDKTKTAEEIIREAMTTEPGRKRYIARDEWNVWYRARGKAERGRRILEERYSLEDVLVIATFLHSLSTMRIS